MHELIRSPFRELDAFAAEVDSLLNAFLGRRVPLAPAGSFTPATDVVETDDEVVVRMDLPGLDRDDVEVDVRDGTLTVRGERKREEREERDGYVRIERSAGRFSRAFALPAGVDPEKIAAKFANGVLELRVPKPSEARTHRIEITAGDVEGEAEEKKDG